MNGRTFIVKYPIDQIDYFCIVIGVSVLIIELVLATPYMLDNDMEMMDMDMVDMVIGHSGHGGFLKISDEQYLSPLMA